jgi:hypothetical protein
VSETFKEDFEKWKEDLAPGTYDWSEWEENEDLRSLTLNSVMQAGDMEYRFHTEEIGTPKLSVYDVAYQETCKPVDGEEVAALVAKAVEAGQFVEVMLASPWEYFNAERVRFMRDRAMRRAVDAIAPEQERRVGQSYFEIGHNRVIALLADGTYQEADMDFGEDLK